MSNVGPWKAITIVSAIAIIVLTIIGLLAMISPASNNGDGEGDKKTRDAVVDLLTVKTVDYHCPTAGGSDEVVKAHVVSYSIGALKGTPPRKWSDAISTPLRGAKFESVRASICHDPLYGVTVANMLSNLRVDGTHVGSLNPWLAPFGSVSKINEAARHFVPFINRRNLTAGEKKVAIDRNHQYQVLANRLNTLLGRFQVEGVKTLPSVKNWHLTGAGLTVGGHKLPEVGLDSRTDKRPALVLSVRLKNRCAPIKRIGFNVGDKRPEVFATPDCDSQTNDCDSSCAAATPPVTPTTPGCTSHCTTPTAPPSTPPPGCTHGCSPTTPPTAPPTTTPPSDCGCVSTPEASQSVPTPPAQPTNVPTHAPSAQPTHPLDPSNPPTPTPGGHNGGSTSQPSTSAPPEHPSDAPTPTQTGDPGGF